MIGEIAASATGHEDFLADFICPLQHQHTAAALRRCKAAQQAGGAGAKNDNVVVFASRWHWIYS